MSSLDIFSPNPSSLFALYNAKYGFVVLTLFIGDELVLLDVVFVGDDDEKSPKKEKIDVLLLVFISDLIFSQLNSSFWVL